MIFQNEKYTPRHPNHTHITGNHRETSQGNANNNPSHTTSTSTNIIQSYPPIHPTNENKITVETIINSYTPYFSPPQSNIQPLHTETSLQYTKNPYTTPQTQCNITPF